MPPGCGCRTARCCAPATCSSGRRPTAATPRRSSATRGSGRWRCGRWRRSEPELLLPGHGWPIAGGDRIQEALGRHRRPARPPGGRDARAHERGRSPGRHRPHRAGARPPAGEALPATGVRRARVRGAHRVAPLRRLVRRQPGPPQAGARRRAGGRAGLAGRGRRRRWPTGPRRWRPRATCAWRATWPSWPRRPRPTTPRSTGCGPTVFSQRAGEELSTMSRGVFSWAADESQVRLAQMGD